MSGRVRHGNPPEHSRFRKGQSGNPKGRPRKPKPAKGTSAFDIIIDKTLTVTRGGVPREVSVDEALQHKTYQEALAGNRAARRTVLKMIEKREKAIAASAGGTKAPRVKFMLEHKTPETADEALQLLGVISPDTEHTRGHSMLIEPWAVQLAFSRRGGSERLTQEKIDRIRRATRDGDTVSWPRGRVE